MSQQDKPIYNNKRFKVSDYNFEMFIGPRAGDQLKDFELTDLDTGENVKLSDYRGKWLVIETGSSTCSMYTKNIPDMKEVVDEFPDVNFVLVYVREAHPGERLGPHKDLDEKMRAAKLLAPRYGEHRKVLVDNFDGDFHQAYGAMPNVIYIVRPDGTIHYRCNWTAPSLVLKALRERDKYHTLENADTLTLRATRKKLHMIRTMWTGGFIALYDFFKGAPLTLAKHYKIDTYYNKHGRFINDPADKPSASELADIINQAEERQKSEQQGSMQAGE
ncbi:MAG: deiodinase-like protein [Pseudomonadota bacterium]|nr:deiodinase-like protein [Pseudomonadota bacterium]